MLRGGFVSQHIDQASLLAWFAEHQRDLPWRTLSDPWPILLSEILLQQTQVSRGVVFWQRLFDRYPTIQSMAESTEEEVLYLWQGAGYYSRARRLFQLSKVVCSPVENGGFGGVLYASGGLSGTSSAPLGRLGSSFGYLGFILEINFAIICQGVDRNPSEHKKH